MRTFTSNQDGGTGTRFALLPETTKRPDKIRETTVLKTQHQERRVILETEDIKVSPDIATARGHQSLTAGPPRGTEAEHVPKTPPKTALKNDN